MVDGLTKSTLRKSERKSVVDTWTGDASRTCVTNMCHSARRYVCNNKNRFMTFERECEVERIINISSSSTYHHHQHIIIINISSSSTYRTHHYKASWTYSTSDSLSEFLRVHFVSHSFIMCERDSEKVWKGVWGGICPWYLYWLGRSKGFYYTVVRSQPETVRFTRSWAEWHVFLLSWIFLGHPKKMWVGIPQSRLTVRDTSSLM